MKTVFTRKSFYIDVIVMLFMILFLYAAVIKLFDYTTFKVQISRSPLIMFHAAFLAWAVPTVEIIATVLLFVPRTRLIGFFLSFSIMLAFSIYIFYMLTFSPNLPCSCGGILSKMGWTEHLIFNVAFSALAVLGIGLYTKDESQSEYSAITPQSV